MNTDLVPCPVDFDGSGMGEEEIVSNDVGLGAGVAGGTIPDVVGTSSRSESAAVVPISAK